ncbi:GNAT family N-acetyltransferase [Salipiger abyssi]|uniref:Ribosomal-protein-alanine N-acetyltransferase n=1 Tax=Salipiger abyssi TaxID=1250539 RepID=A0A1P8URJ0_9RHOB|nr:GNAT family N-acetyltransferase [Salipiger abyssi]APZ51987.1 ribosomal-protein-alanine N-acetyltransferase [Salipiger abyssi]
MTAAELAGIAARAYRHMTPWREADFAATLGHPTTVLSAGEGAFVLGRVVAGEAEILALATDPERQRQGAARAVLVAFEHAAMARGAEEIFLEVAAANTPARSFYEACGYARAGLRKAYYTCPDGSRDDALLMRKALPEN